LAVDVRELGAEPLKRGALGLRARRLEHAIQYRRHYGRTQRVATDGAQHRVIYQIDAQLQSATGGLLAPLVDALKARHGRQKELRRAIEAAERAPVWRFNRHAVEAQVRERLIRWRYMLTAHVADARELLRETLTGPIRFTPVDRAFSSPESSRSVRCWRARLACQRIFWYRYGVL
jgi:hypothetical protein